jgi:porin
VEFIGLSDQRPHDKFGIAGGYARLSSSVRALDGDFQQAFGPTWPVRSFESLVTAVYQYEVHAGWTLQPNVQYITHPGGGATNPLGTIPGKVLKDAAVVGLRTVLKF